MSSNTRAALLVVHPTRPEAAKVAQALAAKLSEVGFQIFSNHSTLVPAQLITIERSIWHRLK